MSNLELVERIRKICKEQKKSISELERNLDFSPGLISRWVRMSPSLDKVLMVADFLGVSLDDLTGRAVSGEESNFVEILKRATEDEGSGIKWNQYSESNPNFKNIGKMLENTGVVVSLAYVCEFGEGYFLLEKQESVAANEKYALYIIPDVNAVPVLEACEEEDLEALWYAVEEMSLQGKSKEWAGRLKAEFVKCFAERYK